MFYEFLMYFIVFLFLCILLFFIFMYFIVLWFLLFEIFIWINIKLINDIQSKKRTKLLIYRPKWKIHFAICFVHKMKKISHFGLTFGRKRSRDSVMGGLIFANLVSKYLQDFKAKSNEAARLKAWRFCVRGKICLGGPPRPPPPPHSAVRVKRVYWWQPLVWLLLVRS